MSRRSGGVVLERTTTACALVLTTAAVARGWHLETTPLVLLLGLALLGDNLSLILPSSVRVGLGLMVALAYLSAAGGRPGALGAALCAAAGAFTVEHLRARKWGSISFNLGQYALSGAAAGGAFRAAGGNVYLGGLAGAVAYAVVNIGLCLPAVACDQGVPFAEVWGEMRPMLPGYFSFGLLGVLIGQLLETYGVVALLLLLVPVLMARATFRSSVELQRAQEATVDAFLQAIRAKDEYTSRHVGRVTDYSVWIGEALGLRQHRLQHLKRAAQMHDVGKLAVPGELLRKPGKLTDQEFTQMQAHATVCIDIMNRVEFLRPMIAAASGHHAHYDGGGYGGLGDRPLEAYVVAVADAFDAMTSTRPYRKALSMEVAFEELRAKSGSQFHPDCVEALIGSIEKRGIRRGLGHEDDRVTYEVEPPTVGVGSAGLGDLAT